MIGHQGVAWHMIYLTNLTLLEMHVEIDVLIASIFKSKLFFCHLVGFQASPPQWQQDNETSRSQGPSLPSPPRQMIETSLNIRKAKLDEHFKLQIRRVHHLYNTNNSFLSFLS